MEEGDYPRKPQEKSKIPTLFKKSKSAKQKKTSPKRSPKRDTAYSRSASLSPRPRHQKTCVGQVSPYRYFEDYTSRRVYGSAENVVRGNNYEDLDSFWDVSVSGSHLRSKSQPRSAPGSDSLQRKHQHMKREPRRHTLGGSAFRVPSDEIPVNGNNGIEDDSRKREAFMDMLAKRYPKYADKISTTGSEDGYPVRPHARRPRDPHRRATVVTYNPAARDYEDFETMSNVEGPVSFQRGGFMRNSMPIVRTPPNTYDKAMGLVFLVYQDETKKSVLPNEITHLDTVRALFVRSFSEKLNLEYLSSPKRKIYILDPKTSIYYQLEDLRDIKDRTVLKLVESENEVPQKVRDLPPEKRGKRTDIRDGIYESPATAVTDQVRKAQTLPAAMSHSYPVYRDPIYASDYDIYRSPTPDMARSGPPRHQPVTYAHNALYDSPDHVRNAAQERHNLGPIPENLQMQNGYAAVPQAYQDQDGRGRPTYKQPHRGGQEPLYRSMSPPAQRNQLPPGDPLRRALSPPPTTGKQTYDYLHGPGGSGAPGAPPQTYIAKGVRASTIVSPLRASGPTPERHQQNRHSLAFTPMSPRQGEQPPQRSQSYRVTSDAEHIPIVPPPPRSITPTPTTPDPETRVRMDKMEEQLASLAAWVQTAVVSGSSSRESSIRTTPSEDSKPPSVVGKDEIDKGNGFNGDQGISDISSQSSQHTMITQSIKEGIKNVAKQTSDLKVDLRNLRRIQQLNNESMTDSIQDTIKKITKVLTTVPGAEHQVLRQQRADIDTLYKQYKDDGGKVLRELGDLESSVEEMREDVISRQCRVNLADVEGMALVLSHVTKHLGELRCRFPSLQDHMKKVMSGEMEVVIKEENHDSIKQFLKDEPDKIEDALKRCKKLTGTLFTLKRLASAQEQRPLHVPTGKVGGRIPSQTDRKGLMENIQALIPDHESRLQSIQNQEAADASRERKKKIITQQEALKFGKSLEKATKALKSAAEKPKSKADAACSSKGHCEVVNSGTKGEYSSASVKPESTSDSHVTTKFSVPLTSTTTEKIVLSSSTKGGDGQTQRKQIEEKIIRTSEAKAPPSTLTSSEEENVKRTAAKLSIQKNAARAAFFSSLTTPPTSPSEEKRGTPSDSRVSPSRSSPESRSSPSRTTMDYTVRISPCRSSVSGTTKYIVKDSTDVKSSSVATRPTAKVSFSSPPSSSSSSSDSSPSPNSPISSSIRISNIPRFSVPKPETESREKYTYQKEATVQKPSILKNSQSSREHEREKQVSQTEVVPEKLRETSPVFSEKSKSDAKSQSGTRFHTELPLGQTSRLQSEPTSGQSSRSELTSSQCIEKSDVRPKKVPPPPPPRKSSKLVRSGPASSLTSPEDKSEIHDSTIVAGNNEGTVKSSTTCTSTPKPAVPQKPSRIARDRFLSSQASSKDSSSSDKDKKSQSGAEQSEDPVKLKLSDELKRNEREGSIESSASSGSSESQQSVVERLPSEHSTTINGGVSGKKPRPPPPVRKSSLADSFEEKTDSGKIDTVNKS